MDQKMKEDENDEQAVQPERKMKENDFEIEN